MVKVLTLRTRAGCGYERVREGGGILFCHRHARSKLYRTEEAHFSSGKRPLEMFSMTSRISSPRSSAPRRAGVAMLTFRNLPSPVALNTAVVRSLKALFTKYAGYSL